MRRRAVIAGAAAALPRAAAAQTAPRVRSIGVMVSGTEEQSAPFIAAFLEALEVLRIRPADECHLVATSFEFTSERHHGIEMPGQFGTNQSKMCHRMS